MNEMASAPFDSIENSHEYVALLLQAIEETAADVRKGLGRPPRAAAVQRRQAILLVAYKLEQRWPGPVLERAHLAERARPSRSFVTGSRPGALISRARSTMSAA